MQERLSHVIDERLRRIVGDKANRQFPRNEFRSSWTSREIVHQVAAFLLTLILELLAHHLVCAGLMTIGVVFKPSAALGTIDGPAGEDARSLDDVRLAISAVYSQRVQLHQLTRVVLVQPLRLELFVAFLD